MEELTELETEWVCYVKDVADGKINLKMYQRLQFALVSEVSTSSESNVKSEKTTPSVSGKPKGGQAQQQIESQIEIAKGRILTTVKSLSELNLKNKLGVKPPHPKTKKQKIVRDNSVNSNFELSARKEENRMKKDTVSLGKKVTSPDLSAGKPTKMDISLTQIHSIFNILTVLAIRIKRRNSDIIHTVRKMRP